ncbi:DUF4845 domain-containing protein [Candidatus Sororendozoicomonas aggregata]|uniref:DUF4845 domain-containing protein n=1 Tax=Candidatus Sororendozoicomonas aggregata TaxID=3073239 RepID=UPI002ED54610
MGTARQGGVGIIRLMTIVVFLVSGVMMAAKMLPYYMDDFAVSRLLSSIKRKPQLGNASVEQVRTWLKQGFQRNRVKLAESEYRIRGKEGQRQVEIRYERRIHLVYNLSLVLTFEHDWNIKPT